jgi:23S rRNA (adenine1618-N6)-methyltransferase
MVTAGGEVAFLRRMMQESVKLGERIRWYSSMVGKLSSIVQLVETLQELGNSNWAVTELVQGNKTRRWALAWSWGPYRPTVVSLQSSQER